LPHKRKYKRKFSYSNNARIEELGHGNIYPGWRITQKNFNRNYTGLMNEWKAVTKEYEEN
jgi:hypothetical protein